MCTKLLIGVDNLNNILEARISNILNSGSSEILCLGFGLEEICNFNCIYCYAAKDKNKDKPDIMCQEEYSSLIKAAKSIGVSTVIISGSQGQAEPLLSPKIIPLVTEIANQEMIPLIFTNGAVLGNDILSSTAHNMSSQELCKFLDNKNASLILSCDTLNSDLFDRVVGRPNAYADFSKCLTNLQKVNFVGKNSSENVIHTRVALSTVIMRSNFNELEEIKKYADVNKWQFICKFPSLMGNALKNGEDFFSSEEAASLYKEAKVLCDKPETLAVKYHNESYCLINQLGIAFNNKGQALSCLSGEIIEDPLLMYPSNSLNDIVIRKKRLSETGVGEYLTK